MSKGIVNALEVVQIEIEYRELAVLDSRLINRQRKLVIEQISIRQAGKAVEVCQSGNTPVCRPFVTQRQSQSTHRMRAEWFLQVEQLLGGLYPLADH